jgi:hypothetical protein
MLEANLIKEVSIAIKEAWGCAQPLGNQLFLLGLLWIYCAHLILS